MQPLQFSTIIETYVLGHGIDDSIYYIGLIQWAQETSKIFTFCIK